MGKSVLIYISNNIKALGAVSVPGEMGECML